MPATRPRRAVIARLALTAGLVAAGGGVLLPGGSSNAADEPPLKATPQANCNAASKPESDIQGRVPSSDYTSGRAKQGYTCNTKQVSRYAPPDPLGLQRGSGGFKVFRYVDRTGNVCAIFDSTLLAPTDVPYNIGSSGLGTIVLDMNDPARPRKTANLQTVAMQSPHESLFLNKKRGLLAAVWGNPGTAPGVIDVYSVRDDCQKPTFQSSIPFPGFGHESGFAPDGKTFYASATSGNTLVAIDVTDPKSPRAIARRDNVSYHGLRLSADGRRLYATDLSGFASGPAASSGVRIIDVSSIQDRDPNPQFKDVSFLTWRSVSIPQAADPISIDGHEYLLEMDEYADYGAGVVSGGGYDADAAVGAGRLINIDNDKKPFVVSNLRLAVHQPAARRGAERNDPGAFLPVQGYAGHYCSAPRAKNPGIVACSMIASGLRIFDIRDPYHPVEVGYFNQPGTPSLTDPLRGGAWAMSAPAYDLRHRMVWYSDGNTGFYAVRLAKSIVPKHYWK